LPEMIFMGLSCGCVVLARHDVFHSVR
jgi:hypothetical protein